MKSQFNATKTSNILGEIRISPKSDVATATANKPGRVRRVNISKITVAMLGFAWFGVAMGANADCNQGCDSSLGTTYFGENTVDVGFANTAFGYSALAGNISGYTNTAVGWEALMVATATNDNTALGFAALQSATGSFNTAIGSQALSSDTSGDSNTATGIGALSSNTTGNNNTSNGTDTLQSNQGGSSNTAIGMSALISNIAGNNNVANGYEALFKSTGSNNTANGYLALSNVTTGTNNIGMGASAGTGLTTGSNNIDIGASGLSSDSNTIRIGKQNVQTLAYIQGIRGATVASGIGVIVGSNGQLGTTTSSARFKHNIQPMEKASEAILALQPVTFRYKKELDPSAIPQFGLVAEQVEKVAPDLVARDEQGKPYSVRYEAVNAMLLNEFLKEHRKVESLEQSVAEQREQIKVLTASLQKVSDQLEQSISAQALVASDVVKN
jgi:hypothetical protein